MASLGTTKRKLVHKFRDFILAPNDILISDMAAMDGGKFFIGPYNKGILIEYLGQLQDKGDYKLALVPTLAATTIFFADVDAIPSDFELSAFLSLIATTFNSIATGRKKDVAMNDILVTKREDSAKYHVYIPAKFGEISKAVRKAIWMHVNKTLGHAIIDENANTMRFAAKHVSTYIT